MPRGVAGPGTLASLNITCDELHWLPLHAPRMQLKLITLTFKAQQVLALNTWFM